MAHPAREETMNDNSTGSDFRDLIMDVRSGCWLPPVGSVARRLITANHGCSVGQALREMGTFARVATAAQRLWWVEKLSASPDELNDVELRTVVDAWKAWMRGTDPFRRAA